MLQPRGSPLRGHMPENAYPGHFFRHRRACATMRLMDFRQLLAPKAVAALLLCTLAGALAAWLRVPLPWMIGPLFAMALAAALGWELKAPPLAREGGQLAIACSLGLYFTPPTVALILQYGWAILAAGLGSLFIGVLCAAVLRRVYRQTPLDAPTALYACIPGGASEMAVLAERYGGRVDQVAVAQSFRILLVVSSVPFVFTWLDVHGMDQFTTTATRTNMGGLLLLFGVAISGGVLFKQFGMPNAFMFGSLFAAIALTYFAPLWSPAAASVGIAPSAMPRWLANTGQVLLGCSLGAKFTRDFFRSAPRFLAALALVFALALVVSAVFGWAISAVSGIHWATAILATAPGGIAEMSLTAKVLQLGVPVVTAFHVMRLVILVSLSAPLYRLLYRKLEK